MPITADLMRYCNETIILSIHYQPRVRSRWLDIGYIHTGSLSIRHFLGVGGKGEDRSEKGRE